MINLIPINFTNLSDSTGLPDPFSLVLPSLIILLLVILNGLFVLAEFALISVRPTQLEPLADEGSRTAKQVLETLHSPKKQDAYIATAQVGISIVSLALGMYGEAQIALFIEPYLAWLFNLTLHDALITTLGYILAVGLLTYLHVVGGEMVPKSIALSNPSQAVLFIARPMQMMQSLFKIPVYILNTIGLWLLQLFHIPPVEVHTRLHSTEELEQIVAESADEGLFEESEEEIILNIFDFSDRQVHQVMTPRRKIQAIAHDMALPEILKLVSESKNSRFPVYHGNLDHIIGILHLKDLVRQQIRHKGNFDLRLLIRPAPIVPEQYPVDKLLAAFKRQHIHIAIVLDEYGGTAGIVTLEDLVEEVVGEVRDEFDLENEPLVRVSPGVLEVLGSYLIEDLLDEVDLGHEEDLPDVETIGGLIMAQLGRPPQVHDQVTYHENVHFTVLAVDGLAVARARVEFPTLEQPADAS